MSFESALSYAALILADSEVEISAENLLALTNSAKVQVESIYAELFAKALEGQDVKALLTNFAAGGASAGVASAGVAASGDAASTEAAAEEKEEEAKEESDDDMGFGLFD